MNIEETLSIMLKGLEQHSPKDEIIEKLKKVKEENRPLRLKLGLDPSAPDVHIGHSVVLRKLKQLQDLGHTAVIIIGDFTGMIGDPTGKSKTRKALTKEQVLINAKTYEKQIFKILKKNQTEIHFNSEWLDKLTFSDVIKLASKSTVARMLERDDFSKRFNSHQSISIHEFLYPLMQGYDSVAIKADVEFGGTDQIFNVLMGRNIQKDYGYEPQLVLFMPILEGIDGVLKMSKSLGNYVGIAESADLIYEKIMKIPDEMIIRYYNLCTDLKTFEIENIKKRLEYGKENPRDIKKELAREIAALYHNIEEVKLAEKNFEFAYQKGIIPENAPIIIIESKNDDKENIEYINNILIEKLVEINGYKSKNEVRRLFKQGAITINNVKILEIDKIVLDKEENVIKIGKGKFFIVKIEKY